MPLVEYICRNQIQLKSPITVPEQATGEATKECGHKQDELRGSQVAGGNDPVMCEVCKSPDHMEPQVGRPAWINMGGTQNLKKGWN